MMITLHYGHATDDDDDGYDDDDPAIIVRHRPINVFGKIPWFGQ